MIGNLVALFPPGSGGLSRTDVDELLGAIDVKRMETGRIGPTAKGYTDRTIRSGAIQWIAVTDVEPRILSHLFTLACVANVERNWNFEVEGLAPSLQATSYGASKQEHYDWHMDWGGGAARNRKISVVIHLSDPADYDGGSLQLTNGGAPIEALRAPGSVTVFPSFVMHRVTPVTRGRRLSAVCWVLGRSFQ